MGEAAFEGPEKKVELALVDGCPSLRAGSDQRWREVVAAAQATILSKRSNDVFDAYLLSESSLFVYDNFLTMITCGRTRLVEAVERILKFVSPDQLAMLVYERKNEHFPHEQPASFFDDARRLSDRVPGRAVQFGAEHEHAIRIFHTTKPHEPDADDTTLEVLMHGIDASLAGPGMAGKRWRAEQLGLTRLLPGFELDEHCFEPAGYSLNGLKDQTYATIHVTPQRVGSYASFETNADFRADPSGVVSALVEVFRPESFDVLAFVPGGPPPLIEVPGYGLRKHVQEPVCGYQVTFQHFFRPAAVPDRALPLDLG